MIKVMKVAGESLSPFYREGDYVVLTTLPYLLDNIHPGDVIVFSHPEYGTLIKQVAEVVADKIFVTGAHRNSIDSRRFGPVLRQAVIGRVIWHIPAPR